MNNRLLFVLPILLLGISDASAGMMGILYQTKKSNISILGRTPGKSYAGTFTFLTSSFIISFATIMAFGYNIPKVIVLTIYISLATTITELISPYGSDNLTIPTVASIILAYSI